MSWDVYVLASNRGNESSEDNSRHLAKALRPG